MPRAWVTVLVALGCNVHLADSEGGRGTGPDPDPGPLPGFDAGRADRDAGGTSSDRVCVMGSDGAVCCAPRASFAAVPKQCPPSYSVDCGGGRSCLADSTCMGDLCQCHSGYVLYHCEGETRPCTTTDPCVATGAGFCARCPSDADVNTYLGPRNMVTTLEGCPPPLEPCGDLYCYDAATQVCCASEGYDQRSCWFPDRCLSNGMCDDNGMSPP